MTRKFALLLLALFMISLALVNLVYQDRQDQPETHPSVLVKPETTIEGMFCRISFADMQEYLVVTSSVSGGYGDDALVYMEDLHNGALLMLDPNNRQILWYILPECEIY